MDGYYFVTLPPSVNIHIKKRGGERFLKDAFMVCKKSPNQMQLCESYLIYFHTPFIFDEACVCFLFFSLHENLLTYRECVATFVCPIKIGSVTNGIDMVSIWWQVIIIATTTKVVSNFALCHTVQRSKSVFYIMSRNIYMNWWRSYSICSS